MACLWFGSNQSYVVTIGAFRCKIRVLPGRKGLVLERPVRIGYLENSNVSILIGSQFPCLYCITEFDSFGIRPEAFQVVKSPNRFVEDMDDHIPIIHEDPVPLLEPLNA